jgi:hypothetical protein
MKKFVSLIAVLLLVVFCLSACSENPQETGTLPIQETEASPKDADYLYNWLTEHGTLVGGTCLQYSATDSSGIKFTLCYDTNYVEKLRWQVQYITSDDSGRTINTQLFLFYDGSKTPVNISVDGSGCFYGYSRYMEYSINPQNFTNNSPIDMGNCDGSTVVRDVFIPGQGSTTVTDNKEGLQAELDTMDRICKDRAQKSLCVILDWLENTFCPTANMTMADFGYEKY